MRVATQLFVSSVLAGSAIAIPTNHNGQEQHGNKLAIKDRQWLSRVEDEIGQIWQQIWRTLGHTTSSSSDNGHPGQSEGQPPKFPGQGTTSQSMVLEPTPSRTADSSLSELPTSTASFPSYLTISESLASSTSLKVDLSTSASTLVVTTVGSSVGSSSAYNPASTSLDSSSASSTTSDFYNPFVPSASYVAPDSTEDSSSIPSSVASSTTVLVTSAEISSASGISFANSSRTLVFTIPGSSGFPVNSTVASSTSLASAISSAPVVSTNLTSTSLTSSSSFVGSSPVLSRNSTSSSFTTGISAVSSAPVITANSTSTLTNSTSAVSSAPVFSANSTSAFLTGTASPTVSSTPTPSVNATTNATMTDCSALCSNLNLNNDWTVTPIACVAHAAGTAVDTPEGQSSVGCGTSFTPQIDICQVTLEVETSGTGRTYMEVWLPNGDDSAWNGRTLSTDNGGVNGCVHYVDMQYVSGLGYAAIGDNAGHNGSSFDGTWTLNNNEAIIDWAYRARHASVNIGKQVVDSFYGRNASYSYYLGCSAGGAQGLKSAQMFPDDFDGIIAGAPAADFNHLQDWSSRFVQLTGVEGDDTYLTEDQWINVQSAIFSQCDEALDGVDDGILEDPTICQFDSSVLSCDNSSSDTCLTSTQITTVNNVFSELYNTDGELLFPALLYGSQVDAFRLGQLDGSTQGIVQDWFRGGIYNDSTFDPATIGQADYARADELDDLHGNPSSFAGDLSAFRAAGKKMIVYHGMADPLVAGSNSQRYYLKVAHEMGLSNDEIDPFMRLFRISGMAHCGVGGISGAGAWMFGQSSAASGASNSIIQNLVDWVENDQAPDTLTGTKFWYDTEAYGVQLERAHCRFPYRTTYRSGDATQASSWGCDLIDDWQACEVGATPRLCNVDGSFE